MRITDAAKALDMSPRMLRYREQLGLVPPGRTPERGTRRDGTPTVRHRQYAREDLATIAFAVQLEESYDISPVALAFALRAMAEPTVGAAVRELGERLGRVPTPARALDIDRDRAQRWLGRSGVLPPPRR
ncbi:MAG: MerR family transcriptional regulator, partial [Actinopolymorphaceae bacterium]